MKKITAREFQKQFGRVTKQLAEGQSIEVTNHGKPVGVFTKAPGRRVKTPDFLANLQALGCDPKLGDQILEEFNAGRPSYSCCIQLSPRWLGPAIS